uniref:G_PROTEIN_RECEP_F1_2 domain-containing protein n=1 Tax=Rhabditophanes sp. KR3021 TaxID=114890 RepID=A0AC35U6E1_9BILA
MFPLSITIMLGIVNAIVVCGNIFVLYIIISQPQLHTATNTIVLSLTIADFLLGIVILPFALLQNYFEAWYFGDSLCQTWLVLDIWFSTASIYNLMAITFDRYMAVKDPIKYRFISSSKMTKITILLVWVISAMLAAFKLIVDHFIVSSTIKQKMDVQNKSLNLELQNEQCTPMASTQAYIIFSACVSFILPLIAMIGMNIRIVQAVSDSSRKKSAATSFCVRNGDNVKNNDINKEYTQLRMHRGTNKIPLLCNGQDALLSTRKPRTKSCENKPLVFKRTFSKNWDKRSCAEGDIGEITSITPCISQKIFSNDECNYQKPKRKTLSQEEKSSTTVSSQQDSLNAPISQTRLVSKRSSPLLCEGAGDDRIEAIKTNLVKSPSEGVSIWKTSAPSLFLFEAPVSTKRCHLQFNRKILLSAMGPSVNRLIAKQPTEFRVARTIVIVVGCFAICWLPFMLVYITEAVESCSNNKCVPEWLFTLTFWLGYANSAVNPLLYSACSRDFCAAFKKVLFDKKKPVR